MANAANYTQGPPQGYPGGPMQKPQFNPQQMAYRREPGNYNRGR